MTQETKEDVGGDGLNDDGEGGGGAGKAALPRRRPRLLLRTPGYGEGFTLKARMYDFNIIQRI